MGEIDLDFLWDKCVLRKNIGLKIGEVKNKPNGVIYFWFSPGSN